MDINFLKEKWDDLSDSVKENWDKFTHEDVAKIKGDTEKLKDTIVKKYDITIEEAEKQIKQFKNKIK